MDSIDRHQMSASFFWRGTVFLFILGLLLHILLVLLSWIGGDQIHLLNLGIRFAFHNQIDPFGKFMTGAGANPGILLQLLIGFPLKIVQHYLAPMIIVVLFHILSGWIFLRMVKDIWGNRAMFVCAIIFWTSTWRLYTSCLLWEPSYIIPFAVVHVWAVWNLRTRAVFVPSLILALILFLAIQIHNSSFVIILLTALLVWKKMIQLDWKGFVIGALVGSLTLLPTVWAVLQGTLPEARHSQGFIGQSMLMVYPVLKGAIYCVTLGGIDVVRPLSETVFIRNAGWTYIAILAYVIQFLGLITICFSIAALWWFLKPLRKETSSMNNIEIWLRKYVGYACLSLIISAALSPIVLQGWQVVIMLPSLVLPTIAWFNHKLSMGIRQKKLYTAILYSYVIVQVAAIFLIAANFYIVKPTNTLPNGVAHGTELARIIISSD
jgi:hypothetical protein